MTEPFRSRRFTPVPPDQRPRKTRVGVRVIVTDGVHVLLFADSDPGVPGSRWWVTPGGGADPGETERQTGVRELAEETGLVVQEADLVGPVLRRVVVHGYSDQICEQTETFYLLRHGPFELDLSGHTPDEQLTLTGHAWVPLAELASLPEPVWPAGLAEIVARGLGGVGVLDHGVVEESTVPVAEVR